MSDDIEPISLDGLNGIENNTIVALEITLSQILAHVAASPKLSEVADSTIQTLMIAALQRWILNAQASGRIAQALRSKRKEHQN